MKRFSSPAAQFVLDNIGWMAVSFGLAFVIWIVATLEVNPIEEQELQSSIPITFLEPANEDFALYYSATLRREARVTVRGPRRVLDEAIDPDDIEIIADLRQLEGGTHSIQLEARFTNSTSGRIMSISPADITVEVFPTRTIQLDARINSTGTLLPSYELESTTCDETQVTLFGPDIAINRVSWAAVELPLQNVDGAFSSTYDIQLYGGSGTLLSTRDRSNIVVEPSQLNCTITISAIEQGETLLVNPVITGNTPEEFIRGDFSANPSEVVIIGDPDLIAELGGVVSTEEISVNERTTTFSREVTLVLPEGLEARPSVTTVTINIEPRIITRQIELITVQPINLAPNILASSLVPQTVTVTIAGPAALVNDLSTEDLRVTADVQGRGAGTYTELPLNVEVLRDLNLAKLTITTQPQTVNIVLSTPPTPTPTVSGIFGS